MFLYFIYRNRYLAKLARACILKSSTDKGGLKIHEQPEIVVSRQS